MTEPSVPVGISLDSDDYERLVADTAPMSWVLGEGEVFENATPGRQTPPGVAPGVDESYRVAEWFADDVSVTLARAWLRAHGIRHDLYADRAGGDEPRWLIARDHYPGEMNWNLA